MYKRILGAALCIYFFSCLPRSGSDVIVSIQGAAGKMVYLARVPYLDEKEIILDSATVIDLNHPIKFSINEQEERLFIIKVQESGKKYQFINDARQIKLTINHINGKYIIGGSAASISLKNFVDSQGMFADSLRQIVGQMKQGNAYEKVIEKKYEQGYQNYLINYINYADTVKSPAGFMAVLNVIDFGTDYAKQKAFITKTAARFQNYQPIQQVKTEVLNMIKIYEEELQVGDNIPSIALPTFNNESFSTASLAGSYYLLDIWSTWCPQCRTYNYYKKKAHKNFAGKNFSIVSIAFDDESDIWRRTVAKDSLTWTQLIDEKMWKGISANTLKFDSIPFNFLVDPKGKIIAKAIRADSLLNVVGQYVK